MDKWPGEVLVRQSVLEFGGTVNDPIVSYGVKRELVKVSIRTIRSKDNFLGRFLPDGFNLGKDFIPRASIFLRAGFILLARRSGESLSQSELWHQLETATAQRSSIARDRFLFPKTASSVLSLCFTSGLVELKQQCSSTSRFFGRHQHLARIPSRLLPRSQMISERSSMKAYRTYTTPGCL